MRSCHGDPFEGLLALSYTEKARDFQTCFFDGEYVLSLITSP